jgi:hypothetical protein
MVKTIAFQLTVLYIPSSLMQLATVHLKGLLNLFRIISQETSQEGANIDGQRG